jgi:hypothetical protein
MIIAAMIFALLMWFKTRASRFVLIGILLLGGVYLLARFFQLYLTLIVLQGFFAILLFVLVVIFQEDLRGFFRAPGDAGQSAPRGPALVGDGKSGAGHRRNGGQSGKKAHRRIDRHCGQ